MAATNMNLHLQILHFTKMMCTSCFIVLPMKNTLTNWKIVIQGGMVNSRSTTSKKYTPMFQNILVGGFLKMYIFHH